MKGVTQTLMVELDEYMAVEEGVQTVSEFSHDTTALTDVIEISALMPSLSLSMSLSHDGVNSLLEVVNAKGQVVESISVENIILGLDDIGGTFSL